MTFNDPLALVIEDDTYLVEIFSRALESVGYRTEVIQDGQTALDRLAETAPVLITLDLHLPLVTGRAILTYIHNQPHLSGTRIILTTADPLTAELVAPEVELVLLKPISFSQLRQLASRLRPRNEVEG